jgi:hypothetical protein
MTEQRQVVNATPMEDGADLSIPQDLLSQGKALQKAGTPFVTSMAVQRPRNLDKIVAAIDREAEYAGDSFWYAWVDKKGNRIEGPSIGLANSLAREWTNCAVTCALEENDEAFYITARFIDLEKGSQMERLFRQRKGGVAGNFDPDRKLDIALQIGSSKAIRNVVTNSVPRWLVERAIEKAKEAVAAKIDPKMLDDHKAKCVEFFKKYNITVEQLVAKAGRPMAEWTTLTIAEFRADSKAILSGEVTVGDLFPAAEQKAPEGVVNVEALKAAVQQPQAQAALPAEDPADKLLPPPMSDAEKQKALEKEKNGDLFGKKKK